ncbi:hypothetical protein [Streptomyces sp. MJP52]|uniref:hypothetical protein n=1 Tax=Streptomyces sp. MJP52 TaxID=2940555 RepID=UPI0024740412|nr:hypothetical protein [Streptomyces sp. MJP52]MDH6224653.1 hypothetical protein [Streptomyces sp. MJP52]
MPTYHEIMTAELSCLVAAADRWEDMAREFAVQEGDYLTQVHRLAAAGGRPGAWTGVAAETAGSAFDVTLAEYRAAQKEAMALAALLRDAYAQFADLRSRLAAVREEAEAAGLRVSGRGVVAADTAERPPRPGETCGSAEGWQQRIDAVVRAVDDADRGVVIALRAVTRDERNGDGTAGGFNAAALNDVEAYEARAGSALAARMAGGETLGAAEVDELRRLFRDNQHDENFSRMFLSGLGADGLLAVGSRANDLAHTAGGDAPARGMADIASGLSRTLATATRETDSPWYERWRSDMREAGLETHASRFAADRMTNERGYQSLVSLMGQGGQFGSQYLSDLGDDLIAAERKDPEVWDMVGPVAGADGWFANDPLDGVLGMMSRDPEGAAAFLRDEERMRYLAAERDWFTVVPVSPDGPRPDYDQQRADADICAGFGAALEAAATGIGSHATGGAGYVEHTEANKEVFRHAVQHLATWEDRFPPPLREGMGRILANHGDTVHQVASAFDDEAAPVAQSHLFEVAKQVSRDPQGYAALNMGLNTPMVDAMHRPDQQYPKDSLIQAARTVGFMEEVRAQSVQMDAKPPEPPKWASIASDVAAHVPVVGTEVQMGVTAVTESWLAGEQARYEQGLREGREFDYRARGAQLHALTEAWWRVHGVDGGRLPDELQNQVHMAAVGGMDHSRGITGVPR